MISLISLIFLSNVCVSVLSILIYHYTKDKTSNALPKQEPVYQITDTGKVGIETMDDEESVLSKKDYISYLKKLYPEAVNEYKRYHGKKRIHQRGDRHILRLILAVESGELSLTKNEYTLEFSNGDSVWIANKYFGYGYFYRSTYGELEFDRFEYCVSLYTFLRLVNLEETYFDPIVRYKNQIKVIEND